MDDTQLIPGFFSVFIDDPARVRRVVAADIIEIADIVGLKYLEYLVAVFFIGFVPGRKHRRRGRPRDYFQVMGRGLGQIQKFFVDNAAHAIDRAIDIFNACVFPCL